MSSAKDYPQREAQELVQKEKLMQLKRKGLGWVPDYPEVDDPDLASDKVQQQGRIKQSESARSVESLAETLESLANTLIQLAGSASASGHEDSDAIAANLGNLKKKISAEFRGGLKIFDVRAHRVLKRESSEKRVSGSEQEILNLKNSLYFLSNHPGSAHIFSDVVNKQTGEPSFSWWLWLTDPTFDTFTEDMITSFQKGVRITVDGIVGLETYTAINVCLKDPDKIREKVNKNEFRNRIKELPISSSMPSELVYAVRKELTAYLHAITDISSLRNSLEELIKSEHDSQFDNSQFDALQKCIDGRKLSSFCETIENKQPPIGSISHQHVRDTANFSLAVYRLIQGSPFVKMNWESGRSQSKLNLLNYLIYLFFHAVEEYSSCLSQFSQEVDDLLHKQVTGASGETSNAFEEIVHDETSRKDIEMHVKTIKEKQTELQDSIGDLPSSIHAVQSSVQNVQYPIKDLEFNFRLLRLYQDTFTDTRHYLSCLRNSLISLRYIARNVSWESNVSNETTEGQMRRNQPSDNDALSMNVDDLGDFSYESPPSGPEGDLSPIYQEFKQLLTQEIDEFISSEQDARLPKRFIQELLRVKSEGSQSSSDKRIPSITNVLNAGELLFALNQLYVDTRDQTVVRTVETIRSLSKKPDLDQSDRRQLNQLSGVFRARPEIHQDLLTLLTISGWPIPEGDFFEAFNELFDVFDPLISVFLRRLYPMAQYDNFGMVFEKLKEDLPRLIKLAPLLSSKSPTAKGSAYPYEGDTGDADREYRIFEMYELLGSDTSIGSTLSDLREFRRGISTACKEIGIDLALQMNSVRVENLLIGEAIQAETIPDYTPDLKTKIGDLPRYFVNEFHENEIINTIYESNFCEQKISNKISRLADDSNLQANKTGGRTGLSPNQLKSLAKLNVRNLQKINVIKFALSLIWTGKTNALIDDLDAVKTSHGGAIANKEHLIEIKLDHASEQYPAESDGFFELENRAKFFEPDTFHLPIKESVLSFELGSQKNQKRYFYLPKYVDWSFWFPPVRDQGTLNSCTAFASISLVEYSFQKKFGKYTSLSPLFLYKIARNLMQVEGDTGASIRETLRAMEAFGVAPEAYWPYIQEAYEDEPVASCYAYAQSFQAQKYFRIDRANLKSDNLLFRIKAVLACGFPCMFGFTLYSSSRLNENLEKGYFPLPGERDSVLGGHVLVAVGYDDEVDIPRQDGRGHSSTGALLVRNSWGPDWGQSGYGWLPYEYVLKGLTADWWSLLKAEWFETGQFGLGAKEPGSPTSSSQRGG